MSKEYFTWLIEGYFQQFKDIDVLCKIFENAFCSPIIDYGWKMFDEVLKAYFTEDGVDWIYYFLTENSEKCYYENNKRIPLETISDLWDLVKDYLK